MKPGWRKTIAALEAVGGVCGAAAVAHQLTQRPHSPGECGLAGILFGVYLLALYAGVMLWRDTRAGWVASVVAQLVQLPKVLSPGFAFMVSYGFDLAPLAVSSPGPSGYGLVFDTRLFAHHVLHVDAGRTPTGFGVSVVSCLCLWQLSSGRRPEAGGPTEIGSPDAVAAFLQSREAVHRAKQDADPGAEPDTTRGSGSGGS